MDVACKESLNKHHTCKWLWVSNLYAVRHYTAEYKVYMRRMYRN